MNRTQTEQELPQLDTELLNDIGYESETAVLIADHESDVTVETPDRHWIMRAREINRSGLSPDEEGFQFGLGRILPRTTDPQAIYSLAVPATEGFRRILRRNSGPYRFRHLGLKFFVIYEDGEVNEYEPPTISTFVDTLQ